MGHMRVVVTGGAGFIGSAVARHLSASGWDVLVVDNLRPDVHRDRGSAARRRLAASHVDLLDVDVRDLGRLTPALAGADAVVHLAAKVGLGVDLDDIDDYVSSNDLGTAVTLRACRAAGVGRFVQASSMVVYGEGRYDCREHGLVPPAPRDPAALAAGRFEPACPACGRELTPGLVDEAAALDPRNTYAATKVAQEHLASAWAREAGGAVSLRLHNVYGPGMPRNTPYAGVAAIFCSALERGEAPAVFEDGRQRRDFVHVDDVARAFAAAVAADQGTGAPPAPVAPGGHRVFNVGSGVVSTVGDMARALSTARRGPRPVVTGQFRLGDVRHITASSERIHRELGWRALVPLLDGVRGLTFD